VISSSSTRRRWTLLYDSDCGFCKWGVSGVLAWDRAGRLAPRAIQSEEAGALLGELSPDERLASWHLIAPGGVRFSGGEALAPLLRQLPVGRIPAAAASASPRLTNSIYGWVARHRSLLSKAVPAGAKRRAGRRVSGVEAKRG